MRTILKALTVALERDDGKLHRREIAQALRQLAAQLSSEVLSTTAYGGISCVGNSTQTVISAAGTPVQVTVFDTDDPANLTTPDHTNDHITINRAGNYYISCSATVNSTAGSASRLEMTVQRNNGGSSLPPLIVDRNLAGGGSTSGSVSLTGIAELAAGDTVEVWIENQTNTGNYVVENIALSVLQVGK